MSEEPTDDGLDDLIEEDDFFSVPVTPEASLSPKDKILRTASFAPISESDVKTIKTLPENERREVVVNLLYEAFPAAIDRGRVGDSLYFLEIVNLYADSLPNKENLDLETEWGGIVDTITTVTKTEVSHHHSAYDASKDITPAHKDPARQLTTVQAWGHFHRQFFPEISDDLHHSIRSKTLEYIGERIRRGAAKNDPEELQAAANAAKLLVYEGLGQEAHRSTHKHIMYIDPIEYDHAVTFGVKEEANGKFRLGDIGLDSARARGEIPSKDKAHNLMQRNS